MKYESMTVPPPEVDRIKLGQITHLPREYTVNIEAKEQDLPYEWFLEKSTSFTNPTGVEELTKELGLSFKAGKSSLFTGLMNGNYDPKTTASALRHEQCGLMAFKHVALGIKYFKVWPNPSNDDVKIFKPNTSPCHINITYSMLKDFVCELS